MTGQINLISHFNEMVNVLKHKVSHSVKPVASTKTEKISSHIDKLHIIDKHVDSELLKTKGLSKITLSDRIDDYAVFTSESSETRPILKWLQEITLKVRRFFGISPSKTERADINLKLLSNVVPSSPKGVDCPQSMIFDYVKKFYQEKADNSKEPTSEADKEFIKNLDFGLAISREIEDLKEKKNIKSSDIQHVVEIIDKKIDNMEINEKLLIPAGWYKAEKEYCDAIIEITKNPKGNYDVRFISMETDLKDMFIGDTDERTDVEKKVPFLDFIGINSKDLKSSLSPLVQIQFPQIHADEKTSKKGFLDRGFETLQRMAGGGDSKSGKLEINPLKVLYYASGVEPTTPLLSEQQLSSMQSNTTSMKTLLTYIKISDPKNYDNIKMQLELTTFNDVVINSSDLLAASTPLRHACYDSGRRLIHKIDKKISEIEDKINKSTSKSEIKNLKSDLKFYRKEMDSITSTLAEIHKYETTGLKTSHTIDKWKSGKLDEHFKLNVPLDVGNLSNADIISSGVNPIDSSLLSSINVDNFMIDIRGKIEGCQKLYNDGDYDNLKLVVDHIISQLPTPDISQNYTENDFWRNICQGKDDSEKQKLGDDIFKLSQFLFDIQRMSDPFNVGSETLMGFGKLQVISDKVMNTQRDPDGPLGYYIDPSPILDLIKEDHYFRNLDPVQHKEAKLIVDYWDAKAGRSNKIQLDSGAQFNAAVKQVSESDKKIHPEKMTNPLDKKYLEEIGRNDVDFILEALGNFKWPEIKKAWNSENDKIPSFIQQQREMRLLSKVLVNKGRNLESAKEGVKAGLAANQEGTEGMTQQQIWQRIWKLSLNQIKNELIKPHPKEDNVDRALTRPKPDYDSNGFNLGDISCNNRAYTNYLRWHGDMELFQEDGRFISDEINDKVVNFKLSTDNLKDESELTQQTVMKDDVSDDIKSLRTIQTGSSRFEQTIALFMQHPEYFNNSSFYRVFECNFFAQGALLSKLEDQPEFADRLINFFQNQYDLANGLGNVETALIFLNLQLQLRGYIDISNVGADKEIFKGKLPNTEKAISEFETLRKNAKGSTEIQQILSSKLSFQAKLLRNGERSSTDSIFVRSIVKDFLELKQLPKEKKEVNAKMEREIQTLINRVMPDIKQSFNTKEVVKELFLNLNVPAVEIEGKEVLRNPPFFKIGDYTLDIRKGMLLHNGSARINMPGNAELHSILKKIGLSPEAQCDVKFYKDKADGLEYEIFSLVEHPDVRIIKQPNDVYLVQRKMKNPESLLKGNEWYQFTEFADPKAGNNDLQSQLPLFAATLLYNQPVWTKISDSSQILVTSSTFNDELKYIVSLKTKQGEKGECSLEKVVRVKDGLSLMNPWKTPKEVLGQLNSIEANEHINVWGKNNRPLEVTFPRLTMGGGKPLSYEIKYNKNHVPVLISKNFEGYQMKLDRFSLDRKVKSETEFLDDRIFETDILPTTFDNFQIMVNQKGEKKVLIPVQEFTTELNISPSTWFNRASAERKPNEITSQKVIVYDVDFSKRIIKNQSKEANAMASYVFFTHKNYDAALQYLEKSRMLLPMTHSHQEIHKWIQNWPDKSNEAIAFKLKAGLMLEMYLDKINAASSVTLEQEILHFSELQALQSKYEEVKDKLPQSLLLTDEESEIFEKVLDRCYLKIMPKKESNQKISSSPTDFKQEFNQISKSEEEKISKFVTLLWMKVGASSIDVPSFSEFSVISDKFLVEGFKSTYNKIYKGDPNSDDFKNLKKIILIASPKSEMSKTFQNLLKALIEAKETNNPTLSELAWPDEWKENSIIDRFEFGRTATAMGGNDGIRELNKKLILLNSLITKKEISKPEVQMSIPLVDAISGRKVNERALEAEFEANAIGTAISIGATAVLNLDSIHVVDKAETQVDSAVKKFEDRTARLIEAQKEIESSNLETALQKLIETGQLQQLRKDRREIKLEENKRNIDLKLLIPPQKNSTKISESKGERLVSDQKNSRVLKIYEENILSLFNVSTEQTGTSQNDLNFLIENKPAVDGDNSTDKATESLLKALHEDTLEFIEKNKDSKQYTFKSNEGLEALKNSAAQEAQNIKDGYIDTADGSKKIGLLEAETRIINVIHLGQRIGKSAILSPTYARVPERLIGLFTEGRITAKTLEDNFGIHISDDEANALDALIEHYMKLSVADKGAQNLLNVLNTLPKDVKSISSEKATEIYNLVDSKRFFGIPSNFARELLTIEYVNGYTLREAQVLAIEAILNGPKEGFEGQIRQLGMGVGKSSVLLPTLLRKFADGQHLSMGLIPEWLWEIVSSDLDHSSRELFGQRIRQFEFDRNTEVTNEWLLEQYNTLGSAIVNEEAVITTKTHLLSFRNKFTEMLQDLADAPPENKPAIEEKLELMSEILTLIKTRSKVIADEVDSVLNVRQELNYAIGKPDPLNPKMSEIGIGIFSKLVAWKGNNLVDPELSEFAEKFLKNEQAGQSKEIKDTVRKQLASEFYKQWQVKGVTEEAFVKYITKMELLKDEMPLTGTGLPKFLELDENKINVKVDNAGIDIPLLEAVAFLRQFIGDTLVTTLDASNNVNYGRGENGENTIPYKASNQPTDAEFGDSAERIAYFCQDYMQSGIGEKQIEQFITNKHREIQQEMFEVQLQTGKMGDFNKMETVQKFKDEYGDIDITVALKDPSERKKLETLINQDNVSKMKYLKDSVLKNVEMANKQVSSNANDMVDMLGEFNGFSGTPWNVDTYHDKIDISEAVDVGTDGKSIEFLIAMSKEKDVNGNPKCSVKSFALDSEKPLQSLTSGIDDFFGNYQVLIDAGAYMKGASNQEIGMELSQVVPTVFIDESNEKILQENGKSSPLSGRSDIKAAERFTYYDQAHTTGTDIAQGANARAVVTIGENLYVRDLLQAIWRMRKLRQGQQIDFIISDDVKKLIQAYTGKKPNESITVEDIIKFCTANQAERVAEDVSRAEKGKISGSVPQQMFWQMVNLHKGSNQQKEFAQNLYSKVYADHLFKISKENPEALASISKKVDSTEVLEKMKKEGEEFSNKIVEKVKQLDSDDIFGVISDLKTAAELNKNRPVADKSKLPKELDSSASESKDSQVQTQRQQQQQQQISVQISSKKPNLDMSTKWVDWNAQASTLDTMWTSMDKWSKLSAVTEKNVKGFDSRIGFSPNFVPGISKNDNKMIAREKILSDEKNSVGQVMMIRNKTTGEWRAAILDVLDYEKIVSPLVKKTSGQSDFEVVVYDVRPHDKSLLQVSNEAKNKEPESWKPNGVLDLEATKLLAQVKLFGGEFNFYDKREREGLDEWFKDVGEKSEIKKVLEQGILKPKDIESYQSSYVGQKFSKV